MPTYEYECLECRNRFEVFQSIKDDPIRECIKCRGKVRKLFGTAGIIFKGSGFYVNDYRKNAGPNTESESSASSSVSSPSCSCAAGCGD